MGYAVWLRFGLHWDVQVRCLSKSSFLMLLLACVFNTKPFATGRGAHPICTYIHTYIHTRIHKNHMHLMCICISVYIYMDLLYIYLYIYICVHKFPHTFDHVKFLKKIKRICFYVILLSSWPVLPAASGPNVLLWCL